MPTTIEPKENEGDVVIARKVSFGSQSDAGAKIGSSIMTLLHTAKKRLKDKSIEQWLADTLNTISKNPEIEIEIGIDLGTLIPSH